LLSVDNRGKSTYSYFNPVCDALKLDINTKISGLMEKQLSSATIGTCPEWPGPCRLVWIAAQLPSPPSPLHSLHTGMVNIGIEES
jgi:hypothetical protein